MYRGFNLTLGRPAFNEKSKRLGENSYSRTKEIIYSELECFIGVNGIIDGTTMQNHWFPTVNADVFLSHSHADLDLAQNLAGELELHYGIKTFIDSCVWGNYADLLKQIDKKYCKNEDDNTYDYDKRNFSTSHVHMMLSTALTMMMDRTECLFFLNTPKSVTAKTNIKNKTQSPWIYSEITTSGFLRQRKPDREIPQKYITLAEDSQKHLAIEYNLFDSHLTKITSNNFWKWHKECGAKNAADALNDLYKNFRVSE